jgi:UDP-N-acetyl-D-glucosamine dehydrogenase
MEYYDPFVPVIRLTREHPQWAGKQSVVWNSETIAAFDLVLIATHHKSIDYQQLADWSEVIVDTRNAMEHVVNSKAKIYKA